MPTCDYRQSLQYRPSSQSRHTKVSTMSRTRYRFAEMGYPYFMTCTTVMWVPVFTRPETVNILLDSWRFLQTNRGLDLFGYVILENHLHFIASSKDLSTDIGDF